MRSQRNASFARLKGIARGFLLSIVLALSLAAAAVARTGAVDWFGSDDGVGRGGGGSRPAGVEIGTPEGLAPLASTPDPTGEPRTEPRVPPTPAGGIPPVEPERDPTPDHPEPAEPTTPPTPDGGMPNTTPSAPALPSASADRAGDERRTPGYPTAGRR